MQHLTENTKKPITTSHRIKLPHHIQRRMRYQLCSSYHIRKSQIRNVSRVRYFHPKDCWTPWASTFYSFTRIETESILQRYPCRTTLCGTKKKCGARTKFTLEKGVLILKKLNKTQSHRQISGSLFQEEGLSFNTATIDHGKEFSSHERIREALGLPMYFADPYYSWKRGSNENANCLLSKFFSKGQILEKSVALNSLKRSLRLMIDQENVSTEKLHTRSFLKKCCT